MAFGAPTSGIRGGNAPGGSGGVGGTGARGARAGAGAKGLGGMAAIDGGADRCASMFAIEDLPLFFGVNC
jgi:hypothetical protein